MDDVASLQSATGQWWVNRSTGTAFTSTVWTTLAPTSGWAAQVAGDFTGDGKDDIANFQSSRRASGR